MRVWQQVLKKTIGKCQGKHLQLGLYSPSQDYLATGFQCPVLAEPKLLPFVLR